MKQFSLLRYLDRGCLICRATLMSIDGFLEAWGPRQQEWESHLLHHRLILPSLKLTQEATEKRFPFFTGHWPEHSRSDLRLNCEIAREALAKQ